jgi:hypothetical protein
VPNGKALFFPIVNAECSDVENDGDDEEDFRACAKALADLIAVDSLAAEIDGVPIRNLQRYRFSSPLFTFGPLPANNVLQGLCDRPDNPNKPDCPVGTTSMAVADGYYLMLPPLSVGPHTVHFTGAIPAFNFTLDITYDLIVAPRKPQAGLPQSSKAVGLWNRRAQVPPK